MKFTFWKINWRRFFVLLSTVCLSGCLFFVGDKLNHVGGHVRDKSGKPIEGVHVTFYGVTKATDSNGCFYFGGYLAASGFYVRATQLGFSAFEESHSFAWYDIDITMRPLGYGMSSASWRELKESELQSTPECKK